MFVPPLFLAFLLYIIPFLCRNVKMFKRDNHEYFFNLQIRFFMDFPEKLTEENILSIGECLKKIDDFKKANPMYF